MMYLFGKRHQDVSPSSSTETIATNGLLFMQQFIEKTNAITHSSEAEDAANDLVPVDTTSLGPVYPEKLYQLYKTSKPSIHRIRVLRLLERRKVQFKVIPLRDATHKFTTISYSWGDPFNTDHCVAGQRIPITKNLSEVLNVIWTRQGCREDPNAWFWIDALCLDQQDLDEKSYHVSLMKEIYFQSQQVWVCLGEPDEASDIAMPFVKLMAKAMAISKSSGIGRYGSWTKAQKRILMFPTDAYTLGKHVRAYFRLLRRDWFRRVWIIQEYCVSKDPLVICGTHHVHAGELYTASIYCSASDLATAFAVEWADPRAVVDLHVTRMAYQQNVPMDLRTLLSLYRNAQATNPRDKIYALVGMCSDWNLQPAPETENGTETQTASVSPSYDPLTVIHSNYKESVGNVFMNLTLAYIERDRNLNILQFISDCRAGFLELNQKDANYYFVESAFDDEGNLMVSEATTTVGVQAPTWVPDFGRADSTYTLQGYHFGLRSPELYPPATGKAKEPEDVKHLKIFKACGPFTAYEFGECQYNSTMFLPVDGRRIDTIGDTGVLFYDTEVVPKAWQRENPCAIPYIYLQDLKRTKDDATLFDIFGKTPYFNGDSRFETLFHCYTAGHTKALNSKGRQEVFAEFKEFIDDYKRMSAYANTFSDPEFPKNLREIYDHHLSSCSEARDAFIQKATSVLMNRRVFRTPGNPKIGFHGFCGLGPANMQHGDVVYVLKGCSVPMVLRQHYSHQWTVVGECYIHGIMDGEAINDNTTFEKLYLI